MLPEYGGGLLRLPQQGVVVGAGGVQYVQPVRVVVLHQHAAPLLERVSRRRAGIRRQPPRQKVAAQRHVHLPVALDLGIGLLQRDVGVVKASLQERCFRRHDLLRPLSVAVGDPVVVGHTFVHLGQLLVQLSRLPVEHHQHRRRAERPAALVADGDGRA